MIDNILPEGLDVKQKAAAIISIISVVIIGIGVFIYRAGDFETDVKITNNTTAGSTVDTVSDKIWVDVEGAVNSPGVYTLDQGSRVDDAISTAGGVSTTADITWIERNINKAQILTDGYKLYLPEKQQGEAVSNTQFTDGKVSINSAGQKQLEELPGIGPVTAQKIIEGRPYMTLEDLKTRKIVGNSLWENIKDKISLW